MRQRAKKNWRQQEPRLNLAPSPLALSLSKGQAPRWVLRQAQYERSVGRCCTRLAVRRSPRQQSAAARKVLLARLESCLDRDPNPTEAAQHVRAGMFVERFAHDVERRLEALEH